MKVGTKSLLFGVHQFAWHPFTVWLAWIWLYRELPSWRECVCIVIHDWGYWGCPNMDGREGKEHPWRGARIAARLFGKNWFMFCFCHSRSSAQAIGQLPSKLCWADKMAPMFDPGWLYIPRAMLSGEIKEYRAIAHVSGFAHIEMPHSYWYGKLQHYERNTVPQKAAVFK